jgi:uncharacterized protein YjlB
MSEMKSGTTSDITTSDMRAIRIDQYLFRDDGRIPNNRELPLLIYRGVLDAGGGDPAAACETLFAGNHWQGAWRNGIYNYDHFHAHTHETLGIVRGHVRVRFGGEGGLAVELDAGDVVVIPAGVGHKNLGASRDLLVVGAYPGGREPDICTGTSWEHAHAADSIPEVPLPDRDPVFGKEGPLLDRWHPR